MASPLARLKKAANLTPTKRVVTLNDGSVFELRFNEPQNFAKYLLVTKAMDDTGKRLFAAGEIAELKEEVLDADLQALMLAIITNPEDAEQLDMKSVKEGAK